MTGARHVSFPAMGTTVSLMAHEAIDPAVLEDIRTLFAEWEHTLSRFDPTSELSRLNRAAGTGRFPVSPLLARVLGAALAAARGTGGAFDPTLGRQLAAAGYARGFHLPADAGLRLARPRPGGAWRRVELDPLTSTVAVPAGVAVDLGGIAKGMAVDAATSLLAARAVDRVLVNAGGDIRVAGGGADFAVTLTDVPGELVTLRSGAIATSTTARRRWRAGGVDQHHLLDPRTGEPSASGVWSVTVAAATCAQAEVAAKTALVLGAVDGEAFLAEHGLDAVLSTTDGAPIRVGAWPRAALAA